MKAQPLMQLFKTRSFFYFYDTCTNTIMRITKTQYEKMKQYKEHYEEIEEVEPEVQELIDAGYLSDRRVKEIENPFEQIIPYYLKSGIQMIILQLTQQCNFRCQYCVYSGSYYNRTHSSKRMRPEIAKKAIDFLIEHSKDNDRVAINFYGGEPLLEFNLLKQCVEYAEQVAEGKRIEFFMTTNGYLLTEEKIEFLSKHNVNITISLDGPKEVHDGHRKLALHDQDTFSTVYKNIYNIKENHRAYFKNLSLNAVVDLSNDYETINNFFKNDPTIKNLGVLATPIGGANRKESLVSENNIFREREYEVFRTMFYRIKKKENPSESALFNRYFNQMTTFDNRFKSPIGLCEKEYPGGTCVVGTNRLFVTVEGDFYPCEKCSESAEKFKIGTVEQGFDMGQVHNVLNACKVGEEQCKNCWAIKLCNICPAKFDGMSDTFTVEEKNHECMNIKRDVLDKLIEYCTLKEFGVDFEVQRATSDRMKEYVGGEEYAED